MFEVGVICVVDVFDMECGWLCILYEKGGCGINMFFSCVIKDVVFKFGEELVVFVEIEMFNVVGVYQVDNFLKVKFDGLGFEDYVCIVVVNMKFDDWFVECIEF